MARAVCYRAFDRIRGILDAGLELTLQGYAAISVGSPKHAITTIRKEESVRYGMRRRLGIKSAEKFAFGRDVDPARDSNGRMIYPDFCRLNLAPRRGDRNE